VPNRQLRPVSGLASGILPDRSPSHAIWHSGFLIDPDSPTVAGAVPALLAKRTGFPFNLSGLSAKKAPGTGGRL